MANSVALAHRFDHVRCVSGGQFPCRDLLLPHDKPVRIPLHEWAETLENALADPGTTIDQQCQTIVDCFNQGALIEVYFGRMQQAAQLCAAAIRWCCTTAEAAHRPDIYRFVLQPYINQGRLERLLGNWNIALQYFRNVDPYARSSFVAGPATITAQQWEAMLASDNSLYATLESSYVIDSLKTLLRHGDHATLLDFISRIRPRLNPALLLFAAEAQIVSTAHSEEEGEALKELAPFLSNGQRYRPVFLLRRAEILSRRADPEASHLVNKLTKAFDSTAPLGMVRLQFLMQTVKLLVFLRLEDAVPLCRLGVQAAGTLRDVILQSEFFSLLAAISEGERERAEAIDFAHNLKLSALYGAASTHTAENSPPVARLDRLCARLLAMTGAFQI